MSGTFRTDEGKIDAIKHMEKEKRMRTDFETAKEFFGQNSAREGASGYVHRIFKHGYALLCFIRVLEDKMNLLEKNYGMVVHKCYAMKAGKVVMMPERRKAIQDRRGSGFITNPERIIEGSHRKEARRSCDAQTESSSTVVVKLKPYKGRRTITERVFENAYICGGGKEPIIIRSNGGSQVIATYSKDAYLEAALTWKLR